ncbi:MAG: chorismate--pyruvate lyase, partial [Proteobacteria bacterium]|nr:chorismate--pyruvate lyase [Pseudomonadota bacterium]
PLAAAALARGARAGEVLWARRSWFELRGRRLLVQEVFLEGADR